MNCDPSDPTTYSYAALYDRALRLASVLRSSGARPGDSIVRSPAGRRSLLASRPS